MLTDIDNNRVWVVRWIFFIFIGYPLQVLLFFIYPFLHLYWRLFIYKEIEQQKEPVHADVTFTPKYKFNGALLDNTDDHGAFTMYGAINDHGLRALLCMHNFIRRVDDVGQYNLRKVSGDVVVAWCFAWSHKDVRRENLRHEVLGAAWNYLKNLGTCSFDDDNKGWVSNRCNNFGLNFCPDSEVYGLGQPMAGPQFYTNSALFALASFYSFKWKIIFWLHWIFMGGWFWMWSPVLYTKSKPVHYAKDITMKALWVHKFIFGKKFWITKPMNTITFKLSEYKNDLFWALVGRANTRRLPQVLNAFFSQKPDASSKYVESDMNPFLSKGINDIYAQERRL